VIISFYVGETSQFEASGLFVVEVLSSQFLVVSEVMVTFPSSFSLIKHSHEPSLLTHPRSQKVRTNRTDNRKRSTRANLASRTWELRRRCRCVRGSAVGSPSSGDGRSGLSSRLRHAAGAVPVVAMGLAGSRRNGVRVVMLVVIIVGVGRRS